MNPLVAYYQQQRGRTALLPPGVGRRRAGGRPARSGRSSGVVTRFGGEATTNLNVGRVLHLARGFRN